MTNLFFSVSLASTFEWKSCHCLSVATENLDDPPSDDPLMTVCCNTYSHHTISVCNIYFAKHCMDCNNCCLIYYKLAFYMLM